MKAFFQPFSIFRKYSVKFHVVIITKIEDGRMFKQLKFIETFLLFPPTLYSSFLCFFSKYFSVMLLILGIGVYSITN